jgi:hypothetical protein
VVVSLRDGGGGTNVDDHVVYVTDPVASGLDTATPLAGAGVHMLGSGFDLRLPAGWMQTSASWVWSAGPPSGTACGGSSPAAGVTDDTHVTLTAPSQYCDGVATLSLSVPFDAHHTGVSDSRFVVTASAPFNIAPHISGMSRSAASPGQTVVVSGSGFGNQGGGASVNGTAATVQSWGDTAITIVVPSNATSGSLMLTRSVDGLAFSPGSLGVAAQVTGVSPSQGFAGDTVTISGGGFGTSAGSVSLGATAVAVQQWTPSTIVVTVPDGAAPGTGSLAITTNGTTPPSPPPFKVLPRVTGITPTHAPPGALIEVDGTAFGTQQGTVDIGGLPGTVTLWGGKSVLVTVPAGAAPGASTVTLTPPGGDAASFGFSVDVASPAATAAPGGGGGGSAASAVSPGAKATPGLILPSASGPLIAHGPVAFIKPTPPPGPVSLKLETTAIKGNPGEAVPFTVTLTAFGKPMVAAPVEVVMVIEPGSDAALSPARGVTDAQGQFKGTIQLSRTPGDHIVLARSGIYSDEVRVVGRGATQAVASAGGGAVDGGGSAASTFVSLRSPVLWALIACLLLFGAGVGLNLMTAPAVADGAAARGSAGRRDARVALREGVASAGAVARFGVAVVAVVAAQALGALRRR